MLTEKWITKNIIIKAILYILITVYYEASLQVTVKIHGKYKIILMLRT